MPCCHLGIPCCGKPHSKRASWQQPSGGHQMNQQVAVQICASLAQGRRAHFSHCPACQCTFGTAQIQPGPAGQQKPRQLLQSRLPASLRLAGMLPCTRSSALLRSCWPFHICVSDTTLSRAQLLPNACLCDLSGDQSSMLLYSFGLMQYHMLRTAIAISHVRFNIFSPLNSKQPP